jgi:hypothetical protein
MEKIICDSCQREINCSGGEEKFYQLAICEYTGAVGTEEYQNLQQENLDFCSTRCMGKWMLEQAKERFGVYDE